MAQEKLHDVRGWKSHLKPGNFKCCNHIVDVEVGKRVAQVLQHMHTGKPSLSFGAGTVHEFLALPVLAQGFQETWYQPGVDWKRKPFATVSQFKLGHAFVVQVNFLQTVRALCNIKAAQVFRNAPIDSTIFNAACAAHHNVADGGQALATQFLAELHRARNVKQFLVRARMGVCVVHEHQHTQGCF